MGHPGIRMYIFFHSAKLGIKAHLTYDLLNLLASLYVVKIEHFQFSR